MIANEQELIATGERIVKLQQWLVQARQTARSEDFDSVAGGYRLEIERMHAEVMEYLLHPPFVRKFPNGPDMALTRDDGLKTTAHGPQDQ